MEQGRFITIEGGEGAGKTTQIEALCRYLESQHLSVLRTREPGGSEGAEEIRRLIVEGASGRWDAETEALLVLAARRDHLRSLVWPALSNDSWVVCDRFSDSTYAYQGYGHGLSLKELDQLHAFTLGDFQPDLTLLIDLPVEDGLRRARARKGHEIRFESMDTAFHERVRQGFLERAQQNPARITILDGAQPAELVTRTMLRAVSDMFGLSVQE
ncbi:dTMP kinase [Fodinicurvata halophila]|uniref:Thymidylate kinase n=1 Tax=Fodinicurvata halophila TaxID=1419723 RepID=A0ABV8ULB9_9PROT